MIEGVEHSRLLNFVARIVGSQDAEDVVQTAYLKALGASGLFRGDCKASSWVYRIAQRAAFDHLRRKKRRPESALDLDLPCQVLTAEDRIYIEQLLAALDPKEAEAILAFVEHGSGDDAARALGINVNTLKSRIRRGRQAIQELEHLL